MTDHSTQRSATDGSPAVGRENRVLLAEADRGRLHAAERFAYGRMFDAAAPRLGAGSAFVEGALAIWNPRDESSGYNTLIGFEVAPDPDRAWRLGRAVAVAGGARVFGVGVTPERADWASPAKLTELGLAWEYEEVVWARWLDERDGPLPVSCIPPGVDLRTDGLDAELFGRVLNRGWEEPEDHGRGHLYAAAIGLPGWRHYLAFVGGEPAAAAALCVYDGVALCMVAATVPAFRGRGLQGVLIAQRLTDAVVLGCDLAVTETVEENASPRNFQRVGFNVVTRRQMYRTEV